jgi:hypothetical protein
LLVPEFAPPSPDLLSFAGIGTEPVFRSGGEPSFSVYELPAGKPETAGQAAVMFDDRISLVGYETLSGEGRPLILFTVWQVEKPLPADLAIFVHLLAEDDTILGQHDALDAAPQTLKPGDVVVQRHVLPVSAAELIAARRLRIGLYQRTTGQRWPLSGEAADSYTISLPPFDEMDEGG